MRFYWIQFYLAFSLGQLVQDADVENLGHFVPASFKANEFYATFSGDKIFSCNKTFRYEWCMMLYGGNRPSNMSALHVSATCRLVSPNLLT